MAFSAVEDAFKRTTALPRNKPRKGEIICPLGSDDYDWFVYDILCNAGITIELIEVAGRESLETLKRPSETLTSSGRHGPVRPRSKQETRKHPCAECGHAVRTRVRNEVLITLL